MKIKKIAILLLFPLLTLSCSELSKLLESDDYDLQYRTAMKLYDEGKTSKALSLLANVQNIYAGADKIDTIKFYIASCVYDRGNFGTSAELYDSFRKDYPRSAYLERAEFLYAMSYYNDAPNEELDQSFALKAKNAFEEYIYRYPQSEKRELCEKYIIDLQARMHKKDFYVGETYYKISQYQSAIITLKNILKKDSETPLREEIQYLIFKSYYEYAKESIVNKQKERFLDVIDAYYSLSSQFPDGKYAKISKKLFDNAVAITEGNATISDYNSNVIRLHDSSYKKKAKLEEKILSENAKGEKADINKLVKLKEKLDIVNAEIERLEGGDNQTEE